MQYTEFKNGDEIIAKYIPNNDWSEGLGFYSDPSDFIQVGTWNYNKNTILNKHIHNKFNRNINQTYELLYVVSGKLKAEIYSDKKDFLYELILSEGDTLILLNCGHGYEILMDNTKVLEVKNGPYFGAEQDRIRF